MIRKQLTLLTLLLLLLPACEQKEQAQAPTAPTAQEQTPPATPPAQEQAAPPQTVDGWQSLPGADKVTQQIDPQKGEEVYQQVCATCHREGIAGAPRLDDREQWQERIAKGVPTLIENSINGYQGNLGVMPPKGGAQSLSDDQVASAAVYMLQQVPK